MIRQSQVIIEVQDGRLFVFQGVESILLNDGHLILIDAHGERAMFAPGQWSSVRREPFPALEAA